MSRAVFVDFDGTITARDTCVEMATRFCRDLDWRRVETDWQNGTRTTAETAELILSAIDTPLDEILAWLDRIGIDPQFPAFVDRCRARGDSLTILSDGYDAIIARFLARANLDLPFYANHLAEASGRLTAAFPYAAPDCALCGCCKRDLMRSLAAGRPTILIGDGRSDICAARHADHVFATKTLATLCAAERIPCVRFDDFAAILAHPLFAAP